MMLPPIEESGMSFGPYDEKDIIHLEKCKQYTEHLSSNGIKTCEFILRKTNRNIPRLLFIEAKTSCREKSKDGTKYAEFIEDIAMKMKHSIVLYANLLLKRYPQDGLSEDMMLQSLEGVDLYFVLVIKKADQMDFLPIQDALKKALCHEIRLWKIRDFLIYSEESAIKKGLVLRSDCPLSE